MAVGQVGDVIGKLTVLDRKRKNKRTYCYCACECGNKKWIRADTLRVIKSCGCLAKKTQFKHKDITGKRYGRLIVLEKTNERDKYNSSVIWKCKCDCESITYVAEYLLNNNSVSSCGCLGTESANVNLKKAQEKFLDKYIVEDTNILSLETIVHSNNTSGVKGVYWDKSRQKWVAQIEFKKKHYNLGRYENKEDAIKARKEAEEKMHKEFLRELENKK